MLDFIISVASTTIEGVCLFVLTLNLFRFRARDYVAGIIIANTIVSISNYLMEKYDFYYDYTMLLNFIVFVSVLIFIFRIALFESMIMTACGFLAGLVVQATVFIVFTLFKSISLNEVRIDDYQYLLQIVSAILFLAVSKYLNKKHWWFTFIPFRWRLKVKFTKINVAIILSLLATVVFIGLYIKYYNIITITALLVSLLSALIFFVIKKEISRFDRKHVSKNCQTN